MSLKIKEIPIKGYERVIHATNETTQLDCIISIHNTKLGPALGGVRTWSYNSFDEQKTDALNLSEAMTLKNSICGINFGGGKATLNLNGIKKTPELYRSYAEAVEYLQGKYLTAGDVNTFKEDLIECSKETKYVYGINVETSAPTARGIFNAIQCTCDFLYNNVRVQNIHLAISGIGKVGSKLAKMLVKAGAKVTASSINSELIKELKKEIKFIETKPDDLFKTECDIISPCAMGGAINSSNKGYLKCKAIVGAANNQLENDEKNNYMKMIKLKETGLNTLIKKGYELLELETFFTSGPEESRAWTVSINCTAPKAAGIIHTDFEKGFIRAETVSYDEFIKNNGWLNSKNNGKMRLEGKDYIVKDGDVLNFRFNT